jgi:hypothetical protein
MDAFARYVDRPTWFNSDAVDEAADAVDALDALMNFASIGIIVTLMVWMFHAHRAGDRLAPGNRRWSRGWTIGGWLVPFAFLIIPRLVMGEIERLLTAGRAQQRVDASWRRQPVSALGYWWWGLWVAGIVIKAGARLLTTSVTSVEGINLAAAGLALGHAAITVSLACGAVLVWRITTADNNRHVW